MRGETRPTIPACSRAISLAVLLFALVPALAEEPAANQGGSEIPIAAVNQGGPVDFEREILPILKANCLACHSRTVSKAGLILETPETMRTGGESGPAIVPHKATESLLLQAASHRVDPHMPPQNNKVNARDLTPEELGRIKLWIDQGAKASWRAAAPIAWRPMPRQVNSIMAVAVTTDGRWIACARGNQISLYSLPSRQFLYRLADPELALLSQEGGVAHRDLVECLAFNPAGDLLASGSYREVKLWRHPRDARKFTLNAAHPGGVLAMAVSPDGRWLATGGRDQTVQLWDAATGAPAAKMIGHGGAVRCLRFSPDSHRLASGAADHTLAVWDLPEGRLFAMIHTPSTLDCVTWSLFGRAVATGGADHLIRLWFVDEGKGEVSELREIRGHEGPVTALETLGAAGKELLSASGDGTLRQWSLQDGQQIRLLNHGGPVLALAARPDGKRFASAGVDGVAKLWDAPRGKVIAELRGDRYAREQVAQRERDLAFASNELAFHRTVIVEAEKENRSSDERAKKATDSQAAAQAAFTERERALGAARTAKAAAEKEVADLDTALKPVAPATEVANAAASGGESKSVASGKPPKALAELKSKQKAAQERLQAAGKALEGAEKEFKQAEMKRANSEAELQLARQAAQNAAAKAAAAKTALGAAEENRDDAAAGLQRAQATVEAAGPPLRAVSFSPDTRTLATGGEDQSVRTWSADDGSPLETCRGHQGPIFAIAFSATNLVSGAKDGSVIAWDLNPAWKLERTLGAGDKGSPFGDRVNAVCFNPDGQLLAAGSGEPTRSGDLVLWQVATGGIFRRFPDVHSDAVLSLDFSPDGKFLASGGADKLARIVDLAAGKVVKTFEGHAHHVLGLAWHRNGRTLLTAGADNVVKVWDVATGGRKANIAGFNKEVTSIRFVGFSELVLATSGDNRVALVQLDGKVLRTFGSAPDFPECSAVTPDGQTVIAGGHDSTLHVWNANTAQTIASFPPPSGP